MNFEDLIRDIYKKINAIEDKGEIATYIPELSKVNPKNFGIHISTINKINFGIGNYEDKFSIQSIAKVLALIMAYRIIGAKIWARVGVEPSGSAFNSLVQLEADKGVPRNPFLNAGAIVVSDILLSHLKNPKEDFIDFVKSISNNSTLKYSNRIAQSEKDVGYRNVALCNFIKSFGEIENEPSDVLDFYYDLCSLEMSCKDLSGLFLLNPYNKNTLNSP